MWRTLSRLIAHKRKYQAMARLDRIIGADYGLFREDPDLLRQRQAALQFKIDLLLDWGRSREAVQGEEQFWREERPAVYAAWQREFK